MAAMTNAMAQAYRTQLDEPEYNEETLAAMQEAEDIASGKIQTKSYSSHKELLAEIEAEIAAEGNN